MSLGVGKPSSPGQTWTLLNLPLGIVSSAAAPLLGREGAIVPAWAEARLEQLC